MTLTAIEWRRRVLETHDSRSELRDCHPNKSVCLGSDMVKAKQQKPSKKQPQVGCCIVLLNLRFYCIRLTLRTQSSVYFYAQSEQSSSIPRSCAIVCDIDATWIVPTFVVKVHLGITLKKKKLYPITIQVNALKIISDMLANILRFLFSSS